MMGPHQTRHLEEAQRLIESAGFDPTTRNARYRTGRMMPRSSKRAAYAIEVRYASAYIVYDPASTNSVGPHEFDYHPSFGNDYCQFSSIHEGAADGSFHVKMSRRTPDSRQAETNVFEACGKFLDTVRFQLQQRVCNEMQPFFQADVTEPEDLWLVFLARCGNTGQLSYLSRAKVPERCPGSWAVSFGNVIVASHHGLTFIEEQIAQ